MAGRTSRRTARPRRSRAGADAEPPIVYVHGIGSKPDPEALKIEWDLALFGRDMGERTRMAYWADILHPPKPPRRRATAAQSASTLDVETLLRRQGVDPGDETALALADALVGLAAGPARARGGPRAKVLPLPAFLRRPLARAFLEHLVSDTAAYFFREPIRQRILERLVAAFPREPFVLVSHSQGTIIAYEALAQERRTRGDALLLTTLGSPLGIQEIQDLLAERHPGLPAPPRVRSWANFADPLDPVAADKGLAGEFSPPPRILDHRIWNENTAKLDPHSAVGYLAHPKVRRAIHSAAGFDSWSRFVIARDVAERLGTVEERHPVLIEPLEPGYPALGEDRQETRAREQRERKSLHAGPPDAVRALTLADRVDAVAREIESLVGTQGEAARVDRLRRFVSARLTSDELLRVASAHQTMRVYAVWRNTTKRKLIARSAAVVQADAARQTYGAAGEGIRWAVLDTGVRAAHPHFATHGNVEAVFDCTRRGPPRRLPQAERVDPDGHGTHVSGIIAGSEGPGGTRHGIAPRAKLWVYKVLDEEGEGEDGWIIKAIDHVAQTNAAASRLHIHGVNLSLGGPFDPWSYGCGHSPTCQELRALWRQGVLVCVASGNEGQIRVQTDDGEFDLNTQLSIGDPANLEDCIAVGSVNADNPHLYGVSHFSSRGPTADGRIKPDVVAPGERIASCSSRSLSGPRAYRPDSGTSMACPHVSGLLAAFLSVRREFIGRPDEVKRLLLRTCTDLGRSRYHQGAGLPNLMKMLLET